MKSCKNCGFDIPQISDPRNIFCSQSCSASFNNVGNRRHGEDPGRCVLCGNEKASHERKYCSKACHRQSEDLKLWESIQADTAFAVPHRTAKRLLMAKDRRCTICQNIEWMGKPIPLVIDHIDGNSDNSQFINYRLVCGNCDMQLPTYKSKNRGKGRAWRRARYAEGKTY